MRVADGDGEKLQEPQPRAVVGRRDQRRQGQRGRGKGGELSHYPSLRQRAGAARGSTRRRAISACRSEVRRVGHECVSTCSSRWLQLHEKNKTEAKEK